MPTSRTADLFDAAPSPWIAALNAAAAQAASPLRVYELDGDGDDRMVVALRPSEWTALVDAGCLGSLDDEPRFAGTLEEARESLLPSWDAETPFASYEELFAFLTSRCGPFTATEPNGVAQFELDALPMSMRVTSRTGIGGEWVVLRAALLDGKWKRAQAVSAGESVVRATPGHLVVEGETLALESAIPLSCLTPALTLKLLGGFYEQLWSACLAVGIEVD